MNRSRFEPSPFNQPHVRPSVSDMARGLPDSHQLVTQLMAREDLENAKIKYTAPSAVGSSGTMPSTSVVTSSAVGFTEQGILLDSATPNGDTFDTSSTTFFDGTISFQMPRLTSGFAVSDVVAMELYPFYIPQIRRDPNVHPSYLFAQKLYIRISEASSAISNYQPIRGDGATFVCNLSPAEGGALLATPIIDRVTFQTPISTISKLTFSFYRPSARPDLYNNERMFIPKTNIITRYDIPSGRFVCVNGDSVSNFVSSDVYQPTDKFAIYVVPLIPTGLSWTPLTLNNQFGWYASALLYDAGIPANSFIVNGIIDPSNLPDPSLRFIIVICQNRINLELNVIQRVGARTNDLTFTA